MAASASAFGGAIATQLLLADPLRLQVVIGDVKVECALLAIAHLNVIDVKHRRRSVSATLLPYAPVNIHGPEVVEHPCEDGARSLVVGTCTSNHNCVVGRITRPAGVPDGGTGDCAHQTSLPEAETKPDVRRP